MEISSGQSLAVVGVRSRPILLYIPSTERPASSIHLAGIAAQTVELSTE